MNDKKSEEIVVVCARNDASRSGRGSCCCCGFSSKGGIEGRSNSTKDFGLQLRGLPLAGRFAQLSKSPGEQIILCDVHCSVPKSYRATFASCCRLRFSVRSQDLELGLSVGGGGFKVGAQVS